MLLKTIFLDVACLGWHNYYYLGGGVLGTYVVKFLSSASGPMV